MGLIATALLAGVLAAAGPSGQPEFELTVCPFSIEFPRNSEGDIEALRDGRLLLAWTEFEGGFADDARAHIAARISADGGRSWGEKFVLQPNIGRRNVMSVSLLRLRNGELLLFYLKKDGPGDLSVWMRRAGREPDQWSEPVRVTNLPGYHVMNNDRVVELSGGRLLAPVALTLDISKQYRAQEVLCYISDDGGRTWRPGPGRVGFENSAAMEPGVVELRDGRVMMIVRTTLGHIYVSYSRDKGETWSKPEPTALVAPAAPASIEGIPSTGDLLIIWLNNPKGARAGWKERNPLTAAISRDEGATWINLRNIENEPGASFGYCSVTFVGERVLLTYYVWRNGKRRGFDGTDLRLRSLPVGWFYVE